MGHPPCSEAFEGVEEDDAGVVVVEVGETPVTTEGDEVVVTEGVVTLQMARHVSQVHHGMKVGAPFMDVICP